MKWLFPIKFLWMPTRLLSVMLVDDNETDLLVHRRLIAHHGLALDISSFPFAGDALVALKNAGPEQLPDLILLDLNMPLIDGWDFLRCCEYLGESFKTKCRVVMVSSTINFAEISRMKADPRVSAVLSKPLRIPQLSAALSEIFQP